MKTFQLLTLLAATVSAGTVTLQTTPCLSPLPLETFTIDIGPLSRGVNQTCGLKFVSSIETPVDTISCLAYRDAAGTIPGSAVFNSSTPALIATNPVDEGSIRCWTTESSTTAVEGRGAAVAVGWRG